MNKTKAKKILTSLVTLVTILMMSGLPTLASALSVTSVVISTTSAEITFDGQVQMLPGSLDSSIELGSATTAANDLRNYTLKTGSGLDTRVLSRFDPYNMTTQELDNAQKMRIYGLKNLKLTEDLAYQFQIPANKIRHATETTTFVNATSTTAVVVASNDPIINYIINTTNADTCNGYPCGNIGDTVTIVGSNFATSTSSVDIYWQLPNGDNVTSTPASAAATQIVTTIPSGLNGQTWLTVADLTNNRTAASRPFAVWRDTGDYKQAVIVGSVTSTTATDIDLVDVEIFPSGKMGAPTNATTHNNGKYAAVLNTTDTYNLNFVTPIGATKTAPGKVSGQTVTVGAKTTVSAQSFKTAVLSGTVRIPGGTVGGPEGVQITAHDWTWDTVQKAKSGQGGTWKVYVPNTSTNQCYEVEAEPRDYHQKILNYQRGKTTVCLGLDGTNNSVNIDLTTGNVTGTIKTPASSSSANPYPDEIVPFTNLGLHTPDWTYNQWTQTNASGNFQFGGASARTDYVLEIEAPWGNLKFGGYPRTTIQGLTVNASGVTNLNLDAKAVNGALRFSLPNVWGLVKCSGAVVENAWVELNKEGAWYNANTNSAGVFKLGGVPIATYNLRIQPPTGSSCSTYNSPNQISITSDAANDLGTINLPAPNISGYVYGPTGTTGQSQVWVNFCPYQNPGMCYGTNTSNTGSISLNVPNGTWRLEARPSWGSVYAAPADMVVIVNDSTVTESSDPSEALTIANSNVLTIRLSDPAVNGLTGRVCKPLTTDAQCANINNTEVGVSNVGINLRIAGSMAGSSYWANTDNQGYYAFGGVAVGTYDIEANPWSRCGETACSRKVISNHAITSTLSTRTKNIILSAPNISGTVYISSTTTTPVANAWVNLHIEGPMMGPGGWYGTNTNQSGQFSFGGVTAGTYVLEIEPPRWGTEQEQAIYRDYSTKKYTSSNKPALNITDPEATISLGNCYLGTPQITGRVLKGDGNPLAWSWIMVHDQFWQNQGGGSTDDKGYFRIGGLTNALGLSIEINLPWGGTEAWVQPSGLTVDIVNDVGTINGAVNNVITLTTPKKTLTGYVWKDADADGTKDDDESYVANARVEVNKDMGGGHFETITNTNGQYTLKLSGGGWWVSIRPDWSLAQPDWIYSNPPRRISFADNNVDESGSENFGVEVANAIISGIVKDPTGQTAIANSWVEARRGMGMGNGMTSGSDGRFTLRVPAGTYEVMAQPNWGEQGGNYAASSLVKTKAISNQTTDVGILKLKSKNSNIKGTITDSAGNPVSNVMVNAFQMDGMGWANTMSAANTGRYELKVSAGKWGVMIMPMSTQYVYQGGPKNITVTESQTSDNNDFLLKIAEGMLKVTVKKADGTRVSDIWGGVWVKDTTVNDILDFGSPEMMDKMQMGGTGGTAATTSATGGGPMGPGMEKGGFAGGGLMNGYTEIKVPLGEYEIGLGTPPGSNYTLSAVKRITLASTDTCDSGVTTKCEEVTLTVLANDAFIKGKFYLDINNNDTYDADTDTVVTGVRAFIHGDKQGGGWTMTEFAPANSTDFYSLKVSAGDWYVDAFIDPMMSFGTDKYKVVAEDTKTTVEAGSTTYRYFKLKKLDKTISGTVKDPDGLAMSGIWVFVDFGDTTTKNEFKGPGGLGAGTFTDSLGSYILNVAGNATYKINAGIPPWDSRDLINPDPQTATVATANLTGVNLQFTASDATISGDVTTADGTKQKAMIQAWSDNGRGTGTFTDNGTYTLKVKSGEIWHVKAVAQVLIGSTYTLYESTVADISAAVGANAKNLTLASKGVAVPDAQTVTFSASNSKTIELSDGLKVEIPAGAIDSEGLITVTVTPTISIDELKVKPDSKDKPIGLNYDFVAKNSSGQEITDFDSDIKITFPYNQTLVTEAGYSENDITPKYFDDTTNTWENYDAVVRNTTSNTVTVTADHFTAGGVTGSGFTTAAAPSTPGGGGGGAALLGIYNLSLSIKQGAAKTESRNVTLSIGATNAEEMLISNDPTFVGVIWEPYKTVRSWTLSAGNGIKSVYAKFRKGTEVSSSVAAMIVLEEKILTGLIRCPSCDKPGAVYMVISGVKHVVPHLAVYRSWGWPEDFSTTQIVSKTDFDSYPEGSAVPFRDGSMFRGTAKSLYGKAASAVFFVSDGRLRAIKSAEIYQKLFNDPKWKLVTWVPDDLLTKFSYPLGDLIAMSDRHPNGVLVKYADSAAIYLIENGKKRPFSSWNAFVSNGYAKRPILTILKTEIYETAEPVTAFVEALSTPRIIAAIAEKK